MLFKILLCAALLFYAYPAQAHQGASGNHCHEDFQSDDGGITAHANSRCLSDAEVGLIIVGSILAVAAVIGGIVYLLTPSSYNSLNKGAFPLGDPAFTIRPVISGSDEKPLDTFGLRLEGRF